MSQAAWEDTPAAIQASAVSGVEFHKENPDASPSASHDSWLEFKRADGWKYGPVKDLAEKTHPCFVPYAELPVEQRAKDYIFRAVCRAALTVGNS